MRVVLGIDTSNYTTSAALADADSGAVIASVRKLLPVPEGQLGLRQSDAVFHHTVALPEILAQLYAGKEIETVAVAVSEKPSEQEGSYMPCFLAGINAACAAASVSAVPLYRCSHQTGHILACLYGSEQLEALQTPFLCYHVSGGTTQALLVDASQGDMHIECVAQSSDLKAGQAVDRIGAKLGLPFPAGKALEDMASTCADSFSQKASFRGMNFSLSGLENKAQKMLDTGASQESTAKFCFDYLANTLLHSADLLRREYGALPLFFAGGVMSNTIIRNRLEKALGAHFCPPAFSSDNAAGVAVYGYLQWNNLKSL